MTLLLAHIGIFPVEEFLAPLAGGGSGALLVVVTAIARMRRRHL